MSKLKNDRQELTEKLIEQIRNGTAPWQKTWDGSSWLPVNGESGRKYKGMNVIRLLVAADEKGYEDNRWLTYLQCQKLGAKVKHGEHGTRIEYWTYLDVEDEDSGEKKKVPYIRFYTVFNAEQVEGLPEREVKTVNAFVAHERAEAIVAANGVKVKHSNPARAYYSPDFDYINVPDAELFDSTEEYYSTLLHEVAHSTGHESRLNRPLGMTFGKKAYAIEELRAELASFFLCAEIGIPHKPKETENHAAYIESWCKSLEEDENAIFKAAYDAGKICDYLYEQEALVEVATA